MTYNSWTNTSPENQYKYNGVEYQPEIQTYITEFRMLDPELGKWWQVDPKASEGESPYAAMGNNPLKYSDPLGDTVSLSQAQAYDKANGTNFVSMIINDLQEQTGLTYSVDASGNLLYDQKNGKAVVSLDANGNEKGSSFARSIMMRAIDNTTKTASFDLKDSGGSKGEGLNFHLDVNEVKSFVDGASADLNPKTMGFGMMFMHELLHTDVGISTLHGSEAYSWGQTGTVVNVMNSIRGQLGESYGQRLSYIGLNEEGVTYVPFDASSKTEIYRRIIRLKTPMLDPARSKPPFLAPITGKYLTY